MKSNNQAAQNALWIFAAAFSLWLRTGVPVHIIGDAIGDDGLFIRGAQALGTGHWLGPYDEFTLAKGMFYPLFIALASLLAIPLKLAEHAVYLLASALTARFVGRRSAHPWLGTLLFVLLAFNPILWSGELSRVIREGLYISLSLAVIILEVMVFFSPSKPRQRRWLAAACGLVLGAFWLTREEGLWIVPALAVVAAFGMAAALLPEEARHSWKAVRLRLASPTVCIVIATLCFALPNLLVASINDHVYGVFQTVEFKSHNFVRAYSALAGIDPASSQKRVVMPAAARQLAYQASPAARELEPYIDGPIGDGMRIYACQQTQTPLDQCHEILAGWFMWVLRIAVAQAGHAGTARDADAFYGRLADELDTACSQGQFTCLHRRPTLAPPLVWGSVDDTLHALRTLGRMTFTLQTDIAGPVPASGTNVQKDSFADLTGSKEAVPDNVQTAERFPVTAAHDQLKRRIAKAMSKAYHVAMPFASALALAGFLIASILRRGPDLAIQALAGGSLAAIGCRLALLAYLDATSIPSANILYAAPAAPFVIVFAVTGIYAGCMALTGRGRNNV